MNNANPTRFQHRQEDQRTRHPTLEELGVAAPGRRNDNGALDNEVGEYSEDDDGHSGLIGRVGKQLRPKKKNIIEPDDIPPPKPRIFPLVTELVWNPPSSKPPVMSPIEVATFDQIFEVIEPFDEILMTRMNPIVSQLFYRLLLTTGIIPYPTKFGVDFEQQMANDIVLGLLEAQFLLKEETTIGQKIDQTGDGSNEGTDYFDSGNPANDDNKNSLPFSKQQQDVLNAFKKKMDNIHNAAPSGNLDARDLFKQLNAERTDKLKNYIDGVNQDILTKGSKTTQKDQFRAKKPNHYNPEYDSVPQPPKNIFDTVLPAEKYVPDGDGDGDSQPNKTDKEAPNNLVEGWEEDERKLVPRACLSSPTQLYPFMVSLGILPDHEIGDVFKHPINKKSYRLLPNPYYQPSKLPPLQPKNTPLRPYWDQSRGEDPYSKQDLVSLCFYASGGMDLTKFLSHYRQHAFFLENNSIIPQNRLHENYGETLLTDDIQILPDNLRINIMPPKVFSDFFESNPLIKAQTRKYKLYEYKSEPRPSHKILEQAMDPNAPSVLPLITPEERKQMEKFPMYEPITLKREGTLLQDAINPTSKDAKNSPPNLIEMRNNLPHILDMFKENLYFSTQLADFKLTYPVLNHHIDKLLTMNTDPINGKIDFNRPSNLGFQSDFLPLLNPCMSWRPSTGSVLPRNGIISALVQVNNDGSNNGFAANSINSPNDVDNPNKPTLFNHTSSHLGNNLNPFDFKLNNPKLFHNNQHRLAFATDSIMEWELDKHNNKMLNVFFEQDSLPNDLVVKVLPSLLSVAYIKRVQDSEYLADINSDVYYYPSMFLSQSNIDKKFSYDLAMMKFNLANPADKNGKNDQNDNNDQNGNNDRNGKNDRNNSLNEPRRIASSRREYQHYAGITPQNYIPAKYDPTRDPIKDILSVSQKTTWDRHTGTYISKDIKNVKPMGVNDLTTPNDGIKPKNNYIDDIFA
jgi:hypothetical protein